MTKHCFGKHHCWNQIEIGCQEREQCLIQWGKENIFKIRSINPELADKFAETVANEEMKK